MRYYDAARQWTKKFVPHLGDEELNEILLRDFDRLTFGRWGKRFTPGQVPYDRKSCEWWSRHKGRKPRFWAYTREYAGPWLVNFYLKLVTLAEPDRHWRIISGDDHATVWDGRETLFDLTLLAMGVPAERCFEIAYDLELPAGVYLPVGLASRWENVD